MTPEAERHLAKARLTLTHARTMLTVDLTALPSFRRFFVYAYGQGMEEGSTRTW